VAAAVVGSVEARREIGGAAVVGAGSRCVRQPFRAQRPLFRSRTRAQVTGALTVLRLARYPLLRRPLGVARHCGCRSPFAQMLRSPLLRFFRRRCSPALCWRLAGAVGRGK
jgi:hypothetical protein